MTDVHSMSFYLYCRWKLQLTTEAYSDYTDCVLWQKNTRTDAGIKITSS